ncbi:hypothetical protein H6F67_08520 [Microcoleus sp. FACHB-1515]|nr:hypothetical protein [Microcoleus sp. FACHB-1515]
MAIGYGHNLGLAITEIAAILAAFWQSATELGEPQYFFPSLAWTENSVFPPNEKFEIVSIFTFVLGILGRHKANESF